MKKAILVVSFGTSHEDTRKLNIEKLENDLAAAFPDRALYNAFTSGMIRKKIREEQGIIYASVKEAISRMKADGIMDVLVQPTHFLEGEEYASVRDEMISAKEDFSTIKLGRPLLKTEDDIRKAVRTLEEIFDFVKRDEMMVFMGHGSAYISMNPYVEIENQFKADGLDNFYVGTVEHDPGFSHIMEAAKRNKPERIYLSPLMLVAGDHAVNDMAGDEDDSWQTMLREEGFETESILRGLGEYEEIRNIFIEHAKEAEEI